MKILKISIASLIIFSCSNTEENESSNNGKGIVQNENAETISYDVSMWFAIYDEGDYAKSHHHIPYSLWSFVYYVNTPKGSSPLVFTTSGKKIKAEEGKLVLFPAGVRHHVPKNRCKNRLVLAGNLIPFRG